MLFSWQCSSFWICLLMKPRLICFLAGIWHFGPCEVIKHIAQNCWFESQTGWSWHNILGKKNPSFPSKRNRAPLKLLSFSNQILAFGPVGETGSLVRLGGPLCQVCVLRRWVSERKLGSCEGGCSPAGTDVPLKRPLLVAITIWQPVSLRSQLVDYPVLWQPGSHSTSSIPSQAPCSPLEVCRCQEGLLFEATLKWEKTHMLTHAGIIS